jgi:signal transduction histidine kinase
VPLDAVVRRVYDDALARADGRTLTLDRADAVQVPGSADHLEQVVRNLVDNALKYTAPGGHVALALRNAGGTAELVVQDDGAGITADALPHVFERFYRAPSARGQAGAGLGLAIADWIVRAHGGSIAVASQPDQGSTFTVSLPALVGPAPAAGSPIALGPPGSLPGASPGGGTTATIGPLAAPPETEPAPR